MSRPIIPRRGLVLAAGAALAASALPGGITCAMVAETPPSSVAGAAAFDPAAFVADLRMAGYSVVPCRAAPGGGDHVERASYAIDPATGRGFGEVFFAVMTRWADALDMCPDHVEQVVQHLATEGRL